jgi:hypothetical protein
MPTRSAKPAAGWTPWPGRWPSSVARCNKQKPSGKGDKKGKDIVFPKKFLLRIQDGKIIAVPGKKQKPGQLPDLEARLDRLLREVEALRRDVERSMRPRK